MPVNDSSLKATEKTPFLSHTPNSITYFKPPLLMKIIFSGHNEKVLKKSRVSLRDEGQSRVWLCALALRLGGQKLPAGSPGRDPAAQKQGCLWQQ